MHEQSLMNNLMNKILSLAEKERAATVKNIKVRLGALSHMSPEHFTEHFKHSAKDTIAEQAKLTIIEDDDITSPNAQDILLVSIDVDA